MNVHKNARLTPYRRAELVQRARCGEPVPELASQLGVSLRTTRKWLARYRTEGVAGLNDRSSRPHSSPRATAPALALGMKVLRLQRWTCGQIARSGRRQRGDGGPDLTPRGLVAAGPARRPTRGATLRTPAARGPAAPGYEEAWSHRGARPPDHRAPGQCQSAPRH